MMRGIQATMRGDGRESSHSKPKQFWGKESKDPKQWLKNFERIARANNWSDRRWIEIAGGYMEGIAADWFKDQTFVVWYRNGEEQEETDDHNVPLGIRGAFRNLFEKRFTSPSQKDYFYQQYHNLKQGKATIEEFAHNFQKLRKKIAPTNATPEEGVIRDFLARVNSQIKLFISTTNPTTLQQAIDTARTVEASMGGTSAFMADNTPLVGIAETMEILANKIKEMRQKVTDRPKSPQPWQNKKPSSYRPLPPSSLDEPQAWEETKTCYKCRLYGHIAKRCRLERPIRSSYNSGRPVHYAMTHHEPQYLEYPYYTEPPSVYAWQTPLPNQMFRQPQQVSQPNTRPPPK